MNREDLGDLKNLYENVICEQPLASARERTQQQLELSRAKAAAGKAANAARMAAISQRKAPGNEVKGVSGPPTPGTTTAGEKPSVPTKVTPAKPGVSSSANATTAQKIKGGMSVYKSQVKSGDIKGAEATGKATWALSNQKLANKPKTPNPLMDKTFGYQTGNSPKEQQSRADTIINSGKVAAIKPQSEVQAKSNLSGGGYSTAATSMMSQRAKNILGTQQKPAQKPMTQANSYEWPSAKTIRDIADAYASIYEAKKKVDQDADGDNDFADVRIARMMASGMSKAEAIAAVKNKSYNEEVEQIDEIAPLVVGGLAAGAAAAPYLMKKFAKPAVDKAINKPATGSGGLVDKLKQRRDATNAAMQQLRQSYEQEGEMVDEATRMRKELGKEGETSVRKELAARSKAYKRSGSVDKTIAAAERGADRPYIKYKRDESDGDRKKREERQSRTLRGLAASRRGSVRDNPRAGMRGYAAKVEGSDKELQTSRQKAMSAGTLTPREKKQLGEVYEIVASYLLENNFAETLNDANVIIENMSENWIAQILESFE
jgi:hypothetical protein